MGIDLISTKNEFHYNWGGWRWLYEHLVGWDVGVEELKFTNDGDFISAETCKAIAEALDRHRGELLHEEDEFEAEKESFLNLFPLEAQEFIRSQTPTFSEWIDRQILFWRECNGCTQR